mgnify:CR=1 FL=1
MIMTLSDNITTLQLNNYRLLLIDEMLKLGASELELQMIKDATIRNAIRRNRKPEDVAWALLQ